MEFSDEQIKQILERYKKSIQYNRDRYNTLRKHDEEYQKKYRYYKNKDDIEAYKERFPDDYQKLVEMGFIKITS